MRYYYRTKDKTQYWSLKSPDFEGDANIVSIDEQEFNEHLNEQPKQESEGE